MTSRNFGRYEIDGKTYVTDRDRPQGNSEAISDGYFDLLGLKIIEGRDFTIEDRDARQPVAIVKQVSRASIGETKAQLAAAFASTTLRSRKNGAPLSGWCRTRRCRGRSTNRRTRPGSTSRCRGAARAAVRYCACAPAAGTTRRHAGAGARPSSRADRRKPAGRFRGHARAAA